jgi:putative peptide zinc metalloprotease protein
LEARATIDANAAAQLVVAQQMCTDAGERLSQQQREERTLTLTAPIAGSVIPPPPTVRAASDETGKLPAWSGTPLESRNAGCYLAQGTLLCTIGDPNRVEAVAYVDETDVQYVRVGQPVRILFDVGSGSAVRGRVAEVAEADMKFVPPELAADKELANEADAAGNRRALASAYQIRIKLADAPADVINGARGRAKISVERQTLALRFYRAMRRILAVNS